MNQRIVPELPPVEKKLRIVIDSDAANEIDDLYAIALAIRTPERFIIERAHAGSEDNPLWVLGLGAATNLASAVLIDPSVKSKVRYMFHARSEWSWPDWSEQFNVGGDVRAVRVLLESGVPLVWFDTGTQLTCPMRVTEKRLLPSGGLPAFLHEYRYRSAKFQGENKGFFDLGDIAWIIKPEVCREEVVDVPHMDWKMVFSHEGDLGQMRRVYEVAREPVWELFFDKMS